jgi:hypothetical protein
MVGDYEISNWRFDECLKQILAAKDPPEAILAMEKIDAYVSQNYQGYKERYIRIFLQTFGNIT